MADGIKELQQRMLDMEKELEMKEARNKQVTKEVCWLLLCSACHGIDLQNTHSVPLHHSLESIILAVLADFHMLG